MKSTYEKDNFDNHEYHQLLPNNSELVEHKDHYFEKPKSKIDQHKENHINHEISEITLNKLKIVSIVCLVFMILEVIGGYLANSIAIMSDAAHLLSDFLGFIISIVSIYISRKRANHKMSFGYHRAEVIGALVSVCLIWGLTIWLLFEASSRLISRDPVDGLIMLITAIIGFVFNIVMGLILAFQGFDHHLHHHHDEEVENGHYLLQDEDTEEEDHHKNKKVKKHKKEKIHYQEEGHYLHGHNHEEKHDVNDDHNDEHEHNHENSHDHGHDHNDDHSHDHNHIHNHSHSSHIHEADNKKHHEITITTSDILSTRAQEALSKEKESKLDTNHHSENKHKAHIHKHEHKSHSKVHEHEKEHKHGHGNSHKGHGHSHNHGHGDGNINLKASLIHVIGDAIQNLGVVCAGVIIYFYPEYSIADPICTFIFSIIVVFTTIRILKEGISVLMEATPVEIDMKTLEKELKRIPYVVEIHDLHVWSLSPGKLSLSCHLISSLPQDSLKAARNHLKAKYKITHSTIQVELDSGDVREDCSNDLHNEFSMNSIS